MKKVVLIHYPVEDYERDSETNVAKKIAKRGDLPLFLIKSDPLKATVDFRTKQANKLIIEEADIVQVHNKYMNSEVDEYIGYAIRIGKQIVLDYRSGASIKQPGPKKPSPQISMFEED